MNCDCNINCNDSTILSKDSNDINLLIKESLSIAHDTPILNKTINPPSMRRLSDVSFRSHIVQDVGNHAETSS